MPASTWIVVTEARDPAALVRLEDVLARHLIRFGRRAELIVNWQLDS